MNTSSMNKSVYHLKNITFNIEDIMAILVIIFTIVAPPLKIASSFPTVRLEELILFVIFPLYLVVRTIRHKRFDFITVNNKVIVFFFLFMLISMILSTVYGVFFLDVPLSFGDINELLKPFKFAMTFLLFSQMSLSKEKINLYLAILLSAALVSAFIGFLQYINLFNFNEYISPLYARTAHQIRALVHNGRVSSTFGNPIVYGGFMMLMTLVSLSIVWGNNNPKLKRFALIVVPFFVISIVLTKSRAPIMITGASILILFLLVHLFSKASKKRKLINLLSFIIIIIVSIVLFIALSDKWALYRFQRLLENPAKDTSLMKRIDNWVLAFEYFKQSPIFGWGPATSTMTTWVENDYLFVLRRYGLLGGIAFFTPLILIFKRAINLFKSLVNQNMVFLNYIIIMSTVSMCGFMLILYFYHELQLSIVYWILAGLFYSFTRNINK